jgi:3D-(3,5/4)-trihydroxycyclohexane-1,2-dione acylhydrolase (decyclizing)
LTALTNAVRVLLSPADTGAVCIALPQDVQGECFDYPAEFFEKRVTRIPRAVAPEEDMLDAADLIASSKKPILICGGGVRYSLAAQTLLEFAQKFNIPIAETQAGKGVIPSSHPLNLGGIGVTGNSAANAVAKDADLVIAVSSRLSDFTTASKSLYPKAKAVTINIRPFDAQKFSAAKVVGDAKLSLIKLAELLSKKNYKSGYTSEIKNAKADWEAEYDRLSKIEYGKNFDAEVSDKSPDAVDAFIAAYGGGVCQTSALALINKTVPKDAIVVGASGSLPGCLQRMWKTDAFGGYNMEYGYSCMGYEIAGALGAKLAEPDREVYAMAGDGSFLMLHSEMHTALQEGAKINILLFDNGGFGCINNLQMSMGIESLCTEFRYHDGADASSFIPVDYAKIADINRTPPKLWMNWKPRLKRR